MATWNSAQLKAITTRNKNILVSASAGSGKTTVLIERLVRRVMDDRIDIDHILAMTFTEAAASEMKKRLGSSLNNKKSEIQDPHIIDYINLQLSKLANANISTIHSFCLSILQDFYYLIQLDPQRISNILDTATLSLYKQTALEKVFDHEYKLMDDEFVTLTQIFSSRPEDNKSLSNTIMSLANLASSQSDPYAYLDNLSNTYRPFKNFEDIPTDITYYFFDYLKVQLEIYEKLLDQIHHLYKTRYIDESKKYAIFIKKYDGLDPWKETLLTNDYEGYRTAVINIARVIIPTSPDKEDKQYASLRKQIQDLEDTLIGNLYSTHTFQADMHDVFKTIKKLTSMCTQYLLYYQDEKIRGCGIDFDDMEHYALAILKKDNQQAANYYRDKFDEIMVDEFQDSNDVQNELVNLIARNNNVFRVGDIKQSIYGFRHARPQLMKGLIDHRGTNDEVIYLSNNYRSKQMIVDFNNELFLRLMNVDGFTSSYGQEDCVESGVISQKENNVPIQFHALDRNALRDDAGFNISTNELKSTYIANQILSQKRENEQIEWKDFVVLVRSNSLKDEMRKAFDELNIPYFIDVKHGFYQSEAVSIVLSCMRCLVNPHDDIAFIATITSPLFMIPENTIANAAISKEKNQSYYDYFRLHPYDSFSILQSFIYQSTKLNLMDTLSEIYNIRNYYQEYTSYQDKTNLDLLYQIASDQYLKHSMNLSGFLNIVDQIKEEEIAEAIPIGSDDNVVRVMSIHQSKGLQYPIVYLWSNSNQVAIDFKDFLIQDSELGIACKHMDLPHRYVRTTIPRIACEHKKNREELEEEMRILYVATTRAQNQMHIIDCISDMNTLSNSLSLSSIYQRKGYTSWIIQALQTENADYFQSKTISKLWSKNPYQKEEETYQDIKYYEFSQSYVNEYSPSNLHKGIQQLNLHPNRAGMEHGTMLHRMIEKMGNQHYDKNNLDEIAHKLNYTLSIKDKESLMKLHHNPIYHKINETMDTYHELPFVVYEGDNILHGFMDFMAIDQNNIVIIDFKSDHASRQELLNLYSEQLNAYAIAMHIQYPNHKINTYIYSLSLNEMIEVEKQNQLSLLLQ